MKMKQFSKIMLLAFGFVILAIVLSSIPSKPTAAANPAPVTVVNTATNPVPVSPQGTTPVSGTVSATQNGMWNVGITNTSSSPISVRDVDNPAHNAVQGFCQITALTAGSNSCTVNLYTQSSSGSITTVPAGHELVIETVSSETGLATGIKPVTLGLSTELGGNTFGSISVPTFTGHLTSPAALDQYASSQQLRLYADPGTSLTWGVFTNGDPGSNSAGIVVISGYLVKCGTGTGCPAP
jgi:hypothetical protein